MIELTRINLLPYREEIKQRKQQQFKVLMLGAFAVGLGLAAATYLGIDSAISNQEGRNNFLQTEIDRLDRELGEIDKLQQEKEAFLAKKLKVEELQEKRYQAAYILDSLNALTPDNTYLTALEAESPTSYKISGHAISDNKIAVMMRSLPSTGIFLQPELLSIKKVDNYQEFTLKSSINQVNTPAPAPTAQSSGEARTCGRTCSGGSIMASKNLKQLDVQNLYLLNMPSKLLLAGLLIVGMLALGYVGVFKDQIETLNTQEAKEEELKETFTRKSIQAASLNNLKAELDFDPFCI